MRHFATSEHFNELLYNCNVLWAKNKFIGKITSGKVVTNCHYLNDQTSLGVRKKILNLKQKNIIFFAFNM